MGISRFLRNFAAEMKKLYIETYGCQMNVADSEVVASVMQMAGYETTESMEEADAVFLNTEIRKLGYNIPPLVNAYMSLSPTMKLFGTAINYGFGDVEETGILIAIEEIFEQKRVRHIDSFIKDHPEALKITSGANKLIYKEHE